MSRVSISTNTESNLIGSFANPLLKKINYQWVRESTFLELAVCAFFFGAEGILCRQSGAGSLSQRAHLIALIRHVCKLSERNASGLIETVERLAGKYYLVENIIEQGANTANQWLNCEEVEGSALKTMIAKCQNLTMFDLGIEGINAKHEASQRQWYADLDQSVGRLRRRFLFAALAIVAVSGAVTWMIYYFGLR